MSMAHVLLNMPGGTHRHDPSLEMTTLVRKVASKPSLALWEKEEELLFLYLCVYISLVCVYLLIGVYDHKN